MIFASLSNIYVNLKKDHERVAKPGLKSLRTVRKLEAGMYLTIEPGCYFIDFVIFIAKFFDSKLKMIKHFVTKLIDQALADPIKNRFLVEEEINKYRGIGGVLKFFFFQTQTLNFVIILRHFEF